MIYFDEHDGELCINRDHLGDVFVAMPAYQQAWQEYERAHLSLQDEVAYERW